MREFDLRGRPPSAARECHDVGECEARKVEVAREEGSEGVRGEELLVARVGRYEGREESREERARVGTVRRRSFSRRFSSSRGGPTAIRWRARRLDSACGLARSTAPDSGTPRRRARARTARRRKPRAGKAARRADRGPGRGRSRGRRRREPSRAGSARSEKRQEDGREERGAQLVVDVLPERREGVLLDQEAAVVDAEGRRWRPTGGGDDGAGLCRPSRGRATRGQGRGRRTGEEVVVEAAVREEGLLPHRHVPAARGEPRRAGRVVAHLGERPAEVLLERVPVEGEERVAGLPPSFCPSCLSAR